MIKVSDNARQEFTKLLGMEGRGPQHFVRVGVKGGGCSGFSYLLDLTSDAPGEMDEVIDTGGVQVVIDQKSALYLEGTVIDFVSEGPLREGFVFKNPNATSSCGCGHSFSA